MSRHIADAAEIDQAAKVDQQSLLASCIPWLFVKRGRHA
jgi:hypothetical protein